MLRRARRVAVRLTLLACLAPGCAPRHLALPTGPGTPHADYEALFSAATAGCVAVRTLTAELALSGRAGRQKLRGRVLAGLAPGALRLEGIASFGPPAFILVADRGSGTLLLPRDRRVLASAPPADIVRALVGLSLTPDDLRVLLAGCVTAAPTPVAGRAYGPAWVAVDLAGGGNAYLRRQADEWRLVAGTVAAISVEYGDFLGAMPQLVRVRSVQSARGQTDVDLAVTLSQIDINGPIDPKAFTLDVPPDAAPLTLDELQRQGPLGTAR